MLKKAEKTLPSYTNPPLIEVLCGIRFQTPEKLKIPHVGLLWEKFRSDYPIIRHAPPIISSSGLIYIDIEGGGNPLPRTWFINEADDQLVQFQFDRFYFNWRKRKSTYPHFKYVIQKYYDVCEKFKHFFKEQEFGEIIPLEFELSYINHIIFETVQNATSIHSVFSDLKWEKREERFLPFPDTISWNITFPLPEDNGKLIMSLNQAIRKVDNKQVFVLAIKALNTDIRDKENYQAWYELAHEWIVRGFTDLTTNTLHSIWGRQR